MTNEPVEVTFLTTAGEGDDALAVWSPISGEATSELFSRQGSLDDSAQIAVREQATRILARCGNPRGEGDRREAHLVVGEVQSGKTLSFTTVIALARDNDFPLVIVVAGTKTNLLQQTVNRFKGDMLANDGRPPAFRVFVVGEYNEQDLTGALRAAIDLRTPKEHRATVVVFVLKNRTRIEALARHLAQSIEGVGHVPALIVDDEADQAGMNVARLGEESTVYAALAALRRAIPRNDMLMYTATPQAPLLMGVADQWAPRTVAVLESGEGYVGGRQLFVDGRDDFVRLIGEDDLHVALDASAVDPPISLRNAILYFLLALAATQRSGPRPLSMLIHPAQTTALHERHNSWTRAIVESVRQTLDEPEDVARKELVAELGPLYEDMASTVAEIPLTLEEAATSIRHLIPHVAVEVVNAVTASEIGPDTWGQRPGWIVIGGAKLDRGFTIENLAVTYMPRGTGVNAVDSIQQRGRFFGYKAHYAGYLRGWFNAETADAYHRYVTHERSVVESLKEVEANSTPLREWKRQFLLDERYKPTRRSALRLPTASWKLVGRNGWFVQRQPYEQETVEDNIATFRRFVELAGPTTPDPRDTRGDHRNESSVVPAGEALSLLWEWRASGVDAVRLSGLQIALSTDENVTPRDEVTLVFIDGCHDLEDAGRRRRRTLDDGETPLLQGRASRGGYLGDAAFHDDQRITIQIHLLQVRDEDGRVLAEIVPALAIYLPGVPDFYVEQ